MGTLNFIQSNLTLCHIRTKQKRLCVCSVRWSCSSPRDQLQCWIKLYAMLYWRSRARAVNRRRWTRREKSFCSAAIALYTDRSDHHLLPTNLFSSAADGLLVIYFSAELLVEEVRSSPYTYNTIIIATLARVMALKQSLGIDYTQSTVAYIDSPPHSSRQVYYCCWLVAEVAKIR